MGVLKKITEEYFGNRLRSEEGKFLDVKGFKVIVPVEYDEKKFYELADDTLHCGRGAFLKEREINKKDYNIKCGGDWYLSLDPLDKIYEELKEEYGYEEITRKQFESSVKFIEFLVEDVYMDSDNYKPYIILADEGTVFRKLDCPISEAGLSDREADSCYYCLQDWFFDEFGTNVGIDIGDIHYINYYHTSVNLRATDGNNKPDLKILLHAKEMVKWWKDNLDKIEEVGVKEFFGFDDYDYEDDKEE